MYIPASSTVRTEPPGSHLYSFNTVQRLIMFVVTALSSPGKNVIAVKQRETAKINVVMQLITEIYLVN